MDLDKQGIFAQTATEEESSDVMARFFHCLQDVKRSELNQKEGDESGHKAAFVGIEATVQGRARSS